MHAPVHAPTICTSSCGEPLGRGDPECQGRENVALHVIGKQVKVMHL